MLGGHRRFPARHSQSAAQGRGRPPPRLAPRKGALSRRREPEEAEGATRDGPARAATAARGRASLRVSQRSARAERQSREGDAGRRRFRDTRGAADTALALRRAPPQCWTRVRSPGPRRLREVQRPQETRGRDAEPQATRGRARCRPPCQPLRLTRPPSPAPEGSGPAPRPGRRRGLKPARAGGPRRPLTAEGERREKGTKSGPAVSGCPFPRRLVAPGPPAIPVLASPTRWTGCRRKWTRSFPRGCVSRGQPPRAPNRSPRSGGAGWAVHGAGAGRAEPASSPRGSRGLRRARFQKEPSRRVPPSR